MRLLVVDDSKLARKMMIKAINPMKYMAAEGQFCGEIRMCGALGEYKVFNTIKARRMKKIGGR